MPVGRPSETGWNKPLPERATTLGSVVTAVAMAGLWFWLSKVDEEAKKPQRDLAEQQKVWEVAHRKSEALREKNQPQSQKVERSSIAQVKPSPQQPTKPQIPTVREWEAWLKGKNYALVKHYLGPPDFTSNQDKTWVYRDRVRHPITEKPDDLVINFGNPKDWRMAGVVYSIKAGILGREVRILYETQTNTF